MPHSCVIGASETTQLSTRKMYTTSATKNVMNNELFRIQKLNKELL